MANVILKDANGNGVEYSDITVIEVPTKNNSGEVVTNRFTALSNAKAYVIKKAGSVDGTICYKVLDSLEWLPSQYAILFSLSDDDYKSYGGNGVICFVTTKDLTVGETYKVTDMY